MTEMRIDLYSVSHGYGFCQQADLRVFFRIEDFSRESPSGPLPICGERVMVERLVQGAKSPQAASLHRMTQPQRLRGRVKSFDSNKGWGFIEHGGDLYFLHRSDQSVAFLPIIGSDVTFYKGVRRGKPRACYVLPASG